MLLATAIASKLPKHASWPARSAVQVRFAALSRMDTILHIYEWYVRGRLPCMLMFTGCRESQNATTRLPLQLRHMAVSTE